MKAWLWQFITGYVKIKIEGLKLLQFVNDAAAQGILLKSAGRDSYSRITAELSWHDYQKLQALAKNRPLRVVALSQGGLPHIGLLALKRLAFTLGLIVCIAALVIVNRFILDVRVVGCTKPGLEAKVHAILDNQGVKPGVSKGTLDLHHCEETLMLDLQEISFASIRITGVVATVNIVESTPKPQLLDKSIACDVVAGRDAVIRKVIVYEGQSKVVPGDVVRVGQVLVDGTVTLLEGVKRVHARADVLASVWYEGRGSSPLFQESSIRTGKVAERRMLEFAGFSLPVGEQGPPGFDQFETVETVQYLLGQGLKGPKLVVTQYYEVHKASAESDFTEAMQSALQQALNRTGEIVPQGAQILESRTDYSFIDGDIIAKVYIETQENIAVETPKQ
jgi:similar to stage IV sporulation protein